MNKLVEIRLYLKIPADRVERIVGRPDDGSDAWEEESLERVQEAVQENIPAYSDCITSNTVEVVGSL